MGTNTTPPGASRLATVAAMAVLVLLPPLYLRHTAEAALVNGDEAIYAAMALEMRQGGHYSELRYDGEPWFPRPPAAVWALAATYAVVGEAPPERAVRLLDAGLCAAAVALTVLLGARLGSPLTGLAGGGLLATSDLFAGYARVFESEPLLVCFVLLSLWAWFDPRARSGSAVLFGIGLGGALLTKQLVGLLPLVGPLVDGWLGPSAGQRRPRRHLLLGLGAALLLASPWHVLMAARHGAAFVDSYLVQSLLGRASTGLLHRTRATFYLRELLTSEGTAFAVLLLGAAVAALAVGLLRRRRAPLLVGGWAIGVLLVYSLARSRYDYYLLLAYPAFALSAAWLLDALPVRTAVRVGLAVALLVASAALHLPRNLDPLRGDLETRQLLVEARRQLPAMPVYTFNLHPYTARLYGGAPARVFVESEADLQAARALARTGMPAPAAQASPPAAALSLATRPSLLLWPRARLSALDEVPLDRYRVLGDAGPLRLLYLP